MPAGDLYRALERPDTYRAVLARLRERRRYNAELLRQGELSLAELPESEDAELSRLLARSTAKGDYAFGPVEERRAHVGGKQRILHRASLADTVMLGALSAVLAPLLETTLSPAVFSYRKGRSSPQAVRELARFVRQHRRERPDVKTRGLHVLRRDVASYGDSIPMHATSPLWPQLAALLASAGFGQEHALPRLLRAALTPDVKRLDGSVGKNERGAPTGSALQPLICNLYLQPLDEALLALGGHYARFGDDLVFAHTDAEVARRARELFESTIAPLELRFNPEKSRDLFWNGAGRPASIAASERERGTTHVDYLGARLSFEGVSAPGEHRLRRLRRELLGRIRASASLLGDSPREERVPALCAAVSRSFDLRSELALPLSPTLLRVSDDRRKLRELDYWVALRLAEAISGRRGSRAFRAVSYRALREGGLLSLVQQRRRGACSR